MRYGCPFHSEATTKLIAELVFLARQLAGGKIRENT